MICQKGYFWGEICGFYNENHVKLEMKVISVIGG